MEYGIGAAQFSIDPEDEAVVKEIWVQNVYQYHPTLGMKILDIGAHKGVFATHAAFHGALVTSYEPHPRNYSFLVENLIQNRLKSRVTSVNKGVWSSNQTRPLFDDDANSGGHNLFFGRHLAHEVELVKFDDIIGQETWDVVKIDTEGAEYEILTKASTDALRHIKYLTVEVHNWFDVDLYDRMLERLSEVFIWNGVPEANGRLNYIYARRK